MAHPAPTPASGRRPRLAVHKFSSCDGCQLAFLDLGEDLLRVAEATEIVHFLEAGVDGPEAEADITFVEGSISTPDEVERIRAVRSRSRYLVTMGACATSGGIQALRNLSRGDRWLAEIYPNPEYIEMLDTATGIHEHVHVDLELWGCPVNGRQVVQAVRGLLFGAPPEPENHKVCQDCKRAGTICTLVTQGEPCMGPVTHAGCGALCPRFGRDCYGCYGPAENANPHALGRRLAGLGLMPEQVARRFHFIHSNRGPFTEAGRRWDSQAGVGP